MKKIVHVILGAFLRSLWIGGLLVVVVLGTVVLNIAKLWPDDQANLIIYGEIIVAVFLWAVGLLHDITGG